MTRSVAFLGSINVGGHRVKMDRLRELFEEMKLAKVETFIASGNVLFDHASSVDHSKLETKLEKHLETALGFPVPVYLRPLGEVAAAVDANPFTIPDGHALHVCFLRRQLESHEGDLLPGFHTEVDRFGWHGRHLYWLCQGGASNTKVNWRRFAKSIGVTSTARNITMLRRLLSRTAE